MPPRRKPGVAPENKSVTSVPENKGADADVPGDAQPEVEFAVETPPRSEKKTRPYFDI